MGGQEVTFPLLPLRVALGGRYDRSEAGPMACEQDTDGQAQGPACKPLHGNGGVCLCSCHGKGRSNTAPQSVNRSTCLITLEYRKIKQSTSVK
jgi:hypothetical protein